MLEVEGESVWKKRISRVLSEVRTGHEEEEEEGEAEPREEAPRRKMKRRRIRGKKRRGGKRTLTTKDIEINQKK